VIGDEEQWDENNRFSDYKADESQVLYEPGLGGMGQVAGDPAGDNEAAKYEEPVYAEQLAGDAFGDAACEEEDFDKSECEYGGEEVEVGFYYKNVMGAGLCALIAI